MKNNRSVFFRVLLGFSISLLFVFPETKAFSFEATLSWDKNPETDIAGYRVFAREADQDYDYSSPVWDGPETNYRITGLEKEKYYFFVVRAYNKAGLESLDSNEVTYFHPDQIPVAEAGASQVASFGETINLESSVEMDPEDSISSYKWEQIAGDPVELSDPEDARPWFIAEYSDLDNEAFIFKLTVTDKYNFSSSDIAIVNITQNQIPPAIGGGAKEITVSEGTTIVLKFPSIEEKYNSGFQWIQKSGPSVALSDSQSASPHFFAPYVGEDGAELVFSLVVWDKNGLAGSIDEKISVQDNQIIDYPYPVSGFFSRSGDHMGIKSGNNGSIVALSIVNSSEDYFPFSPEDFVYGMFYSEIKLGSPGEKTAVSFYFPNPVQSGEQWYLKGPSGDWLPYDDAAATDLSQGKVVLILEDGGFGDMDGLENGIIVSRGGLVASANAGISKANVTREGSSSGSCFISSFEIPASRGFYLIFLFMAALGIFMVRSLHRTVP